MLRLSPSPKTSRFPFSILRYPPWIRTFACSMASSSSSSTAAAAESHSVGGAVQKYKPRYVDIGINLTDPVYTGLYHGRQHHPSDLEAVLKRANDVGCSKMIVTGSDIASSLQAVELAKAYPGKLYATIGVHPCSTTQFLPSPSTHLSQLRTLALASSTHKTAIAFGEIGLDYDRLTLSPKDVQLTYFAAQLDIAAETNLPLFLHSRASRVDFLRLLKERVAKGGLEKRGVVHSFTGSVEEMRELVDDGWDIGVNGCSLKTAENCEVVKQIPLERLQLETDGPWCEIRPSHASWEFVKDFVGQSESGKEGKGPDGEGWKSVKKERWVEGTVVKGRNEPCFIGRVAWAVAGIRGVSVEVVAEAAWANTVRMFGLEG